jgi:hypothetical protein
MNTKSNSTAGSSCPATTCSPFWYGVGAFFVTPVAAIFCILMGVMMILAWPFIPFLCYMQKKEEIEDQEEHAKRVAEAARNMATEKANER